MAESLQQLILHTLDAHSTIQDTRSLTIPGQAQPATSHEDQNNILGALNSLLSRDVRSDLVIYHIL
jgi:phenylalanyl-tRNA synthetase alpha chain